MAEINLLKNELRKGSILGRGGVFTFYIVIGIFAVELLGYGGMAFYQRAMEKERVTVEAGTTNVDLEIGKLDKDLKDAVAKQRRLANLAILLGHHIHWSGVFEELEDFTYKQASYSSFESDIAKNQIRLSGLVPSYTDLGKLILGLKQSENIKDVTLQSSGLSRSEQAGFSFVLELVFDSKLLSRAK